MNWPQFLRDTESAATAYNTYNTVRKLESLNESLSDFKKQSIQETEKLRNSIERGFGLLSLEMAVQSQIFKNILSVLSEKRKTEAEELKSFGLKALRNGWINDAIEDFNKSLEFNRYDYQVYYLLSKCYFLLNDFDKQNNYLQMAFQYSTEDAGFRQYIGLDIVGHLVKDKKFIEANDVVEFLENYLNNNLDLSPLLMCKIYIDVVSKNVTNKTLEFIDKAIENYESDDPSKIILVIRALSFLVDDNSKEQIENKLNLKKLATIKKYASNVLIYLQNIERIITFIYSNDDGSSIIKNTPKIVIERFFPFYNQIPSIIDKIRLLKTKINEIKIEEFDKFSFIAPLIKHCEGGILEGVKAVYKKNEEGNFNSAPFEQPFKLELDFKLDNGDKILVQSKLINGELITLSYFKLIIIDKNKTTFTYDLFKDFINVVKEVIRTDELSAGTSLVDKITFYLRDKMNESILLFSSGSTYSESYGSKNKFANVLNLLWSRAINNILIYINYDRFNNSLSLLTDCLNFISPDMKISTKEAATKIIHNKSDVEFID